MTLSDNEKKVLLYLQEKHRLSLKELEKETELSESTLNTVCDRLFLKGLVKKHETTKEFYGLGIGGHKYIKEGLPERKVIEFLKTRGTVEVKKIVEALGKDITEIGLKWAKSEGYVEVPKFMAVYSISISEKGRFALARKLPQEEVLHLIAQDKSIPHSFASDLKKLLTRPGVLVKKELKDKVFEITEKGLAVSKTELLEAGEITTLVPELIVTGKWKEAKLKRFEVDAPVPQIYIGRRHFVNQAIDYVRKVWLEMGFKEMTGPLINTAFWNFDALFIPQEHPAREMQDTLFIEGEEYLPEKLVDKIRKTHEKGVAGSKGWGGVWSEKLARQLLLRTHTTVLSARTLAQLKKDDWPAKYFALGRCFRNETVDWKHTFEFNQFEGIVVDENANFRHLIGYLKAFFKKLGFENARFRPSYFPYTEPSLEIDIFNPAKKEWVELGGAGIFRPEVTEPLLGEPVPVLAWGPGLERTIKDYYKITDIRELYKNDIKQLREIKQWLM